MGVSSSVNSDKNARPALMSNIITKAKKPSFQANGNQNKYVNPKNSEGEYREFSVPIPKENLKHIIHDLNHHLMLIGISADN